VKNEATKGLESAKSFVREYSGDMSREKLSLGWNEDIERLRRLYREAVGENEGGVSQRSTAEKLSLLANATLRRMTPVRRLIFSSSVIGFALGSMSGSGLSGLLVPGSFVAMAMLLLFELLDKLDAQKEIDFARKIQLSLFPNSNYQFDGVQYASFATTAKDVGGDYVDVLATETGVYVVIADVSGKGLQAALYMIRLQALVQLLVKKNQPSPKDLLLELNNYVKSGKRDKTFVTACVCFFPKNKDYFSIVRAGHNAPAFYSREKDATLELMPKGFALGMTTSERLARELQEIKVSFKPGDSLLVYTDGLVESRNPLGQEYGAGKILSILDIYGSLDAPTIVKKVHTSLEAFIGTERPLDDITFTCIHKPM
jgi:serine phosphatase RsbU (regulator of sigma subunit)